MDDSLYREAKELVCQTLELPPEELGDETLFIDDLGIDSILIIEMKTRFEETYHIKIDKADLPSLNSLLDVVTYLETRNIRATKIA